MGISMKTIGDYPQQADEYRAIANRFSSPQEREMLLKMARTWDSLADDRKAHILADPNGETRQRDHAVKFILRPGAS